MAFGILCALLIPAASGCFWKSIPPCTCDSSDPNKTVVKCNAVESDNLLKSSLLYVQGQKIHSLYILNTSLMYLETDIFRGLSIENLYLINSVFIDLTDTEVAFGGLKKSLKSLVIEDCTIFNDLNWKEFQNLSSLTKIKMVRLGLNIIDSDIMSLSPLKLDSLELNEDSINYIDDWAFSRFANLKNLSLAGNLISEVKRSMFPDPATNLLEIDLSDNVIETLPDDIFTKMPRIISIKLAGNKITTIDKQVFYPVWYLLDELDLSDNPLKCDCRLDWLIVLSFPYYTFESGIRISSLSSINVAREYRYTRDIRCKSTGIKSGDHGGHLILQSRLINQSSLKISNRNGFAEHATWDEQQCLKVTAQLICFSQLARSHKRVRYRFALTVHAFQSNTGQCSSKMKGQKRNTVVKPLQTGTCGEHNGLVVCSRRFDKPHTLVFSVLTSSYSVNRCSNVLPPTSIRAWQRLASDWLTLSKMPGVSRTVAQQPESLTMRSSSESNGIS
ncbi:hypothetical protein AVEN_234405-1 [Araneus ventricosus]|uniref:Uncharacterized protein n=1 Tax=Araneus ventricosus TaxID=182803 RepID=A0A4Y2A8M3_ARAVE|nr:hypothetical protein AVEN_234405-1 [Araneus ventricosus]